MKDHGKLLTTHTLTHIHVYGLCVCVCRTFSLSLKFVAVSLRASACIFGANTGARSAGKGSGFRERVYYLRNY
jgi:hypothetical protein